MNGPTDSAVQEAALQARRSGLAVASLVLGILTFVPPLTLAAIPAVICGHKALRKIKGSPDSLRGHRAALAGTIMGWLGIVLAFVVFPMTLPALSHARERYRRISCASNLHSLILTIDTYSMDYDSFYPDKLSRLYPNYVSTLEIFKCPSTNHQVSSPERIEEDGSYIYVHGLTEKHPPDTLVLYDKPGNHNRYGTPGRNEAYVHRKGEWRSGG